MTITFKITPIEQDCIIKTVVKGDALDVIEVRDMYQQILCEASIRGYKRLLFDARELHVGYSAEEVMNFMRLMHDESWFKGMRLARLLKHDNYAHSLVAELAKRLQLPIRNFEDEQQASSWLMEIH